MMRWETIHGAVRWDAYETKIDMTGTLNLDELDDLIATLQKARLEREDAEPPRVTSEAEGGRVDGEVQDRSGQRGRDLSETGLPHEAGERAGDDRAERIHSAGGHHDVHHAVRLESEDQPVEEARGQQLPSGDRDRRSTPRVDSGASVIRPESNEGSASLPSSGGRNHPRAPARQFQIRINHRIRVPEVRVIDVNGEMLGVLTTQEALRRAQEQGLDLVEVNPKGEPPVCKIFDLGKYKYKYTHDGEAKRDDETGHFQTCPWASGRTNDPSLCPCFSRTTKAELEYREGGWIKDGNMAVCPECKQVQEGTVGWHLLHEKSCKWKPAGTWFEERLTNEMHAEIPPIPTFEEAWKKKEAEGYQYGRDALEGVRFGWEIRDSYGPRSKKERP